MIVRPKQTATATADALVTASGGGPDYPLTLHPAISASKLLAYLPATGERGDVVRVPKGQVRTVVLLAWDADGRLLIGNGEEGFTAKIIESSSLAHITTPPWAEPHGDIELDAEALATLDRGRVTFIEGLGTGTALLRLSAAGLSLDVTVEIEPEVPTRAPRR